MQYHASLITADGAYHCPVGSIMAIFITKAEIIITITITFRLASSLGEGEYLSVESEQEEEEEEDYLIPLQVQVLSQFCPNS